MISKYVARGKRFWQVDLYLKFPDGRVVRRRKGRIPTREIAAALESKWTAEAFEGKYFDRDKEPTLTVEQAWKLYRGISERDNDSSRSDTSRAKHLLAALGDRPAAGLGQADVDAYRTLRLGQLTRRGAPPSPQTLDHEVELLKRFLGYAARCGKLKSNPVASVALLRVPNVRRSVVDDEGFERLFEAASQELRPILLVAFDTGMRFSEVRLLRRSQLDLAAGVIRLAPQDTKAEEHRAVYLQARTLEALKALPAQLRSPYLFVNPETGEPWVNLRKTFKAAKTAAGLPDLWFHDLRRSFITLARRRGVPESVVMRMSGHRTRAVFDRYNIVNEDDVREAAKRIEAARDGRSSVAVSENAKASPKAGPLK